MKSFKSWCDRHFLGSDILFSIIIALIPIALLHFIVAWENVYDRFGSNLIVVFKTTASVSGSLIGFSMAVNVLALNLWQTDRFNLIKLNFEATRGIWTTLNQTTWYLVLLTGVSLLCIFLSSECDTLTWTIITILFISALTISAARLFRAIYIISKMIEITIAASKVNESETE